jgi:hypothetical protein
VRASRPHALTAAKGGGQVKRFATSAIVLVALAVGVTSAAAANGGATVVTTPVSFVLSSATCSYLPAGTTVTGSALETSITTVRTADDGVTTIVNATHAQGTATDQDGNVYVFNYSNEFRVSNTVADQGVFSGLMTDAFSLAGKGPASLHNGFVAELTTDFSVFFSWNVRHASGDPLDFATGPVVAHCDPL